MAESKVPHPPPNQFLSTTYSQLPHYLFLALADRTYPTPPLLDSVSSDDPPCIEVADEEDAVLLGCGVFEYNFGLEVCSLILEDDC